MIGGGDTGADCMSNALREGAKSVTQLDTYPAPAGSRPREIAGWPLSPRRLPTHYALDEGGERRSAVAVTAIAEERRLRRRGRGGPRRSRATAPSTCPTGRSASPPTSSWSRSASPAPETELLDALGVTRTEDSGVGHHATDVPGVFAAGDARMGARLTVTAINDGRACARAVDAWLATRV